RRIAQLPRARTRLARRNCFQGHRRTRRLHPTRPGAWRGSRRRSPALRIEPHGPDGARRFVARDPRAGRGGAARSSRSCSATCRDGAARFAQGAERMRMLPVAAASLLLAGCTVGPDYEPPLASVPPAYAEEGSGPGASDADLASWWRGFGDPELDKLVNQAIAQNLDVQTAAARIREARALERASGAAALPRLDAQSSASRQRISEHAIPVPPGGGGTGNSGSFGLPGSEFNTFRIGFDASWEVDLFGKTRRSVEAARARTGAAIWNRRDAQVMAAAEVAESYVALRTLQWRIVTAEAEVALQQRFVRLADARVRGGLVTGESLAQQESQLKTAQAAIPPLKA